MIALRSLAALTAAFALTAAAAGPDRSLDLRRPFAARSPWRIIVTGGPAMPDPIMGDGEVPGVVTLCLTRDAGRRCDPQPGTSLRIAGAPDLYDAAHELRRLAIVRPRPDRPLLLIQSASLHSVDGDQRIGTELYGYDRATDAFALVYRRQTGRNNNQEVRYIDAGPLAGAVVAAEPTPHAPFGFWITVSRIGAAGGYRPVLRYRSVTRYADGNPLAVIDSDMPAMLARLGLWRPGTRPSTPSACPTPRVVRGELWCVAPPAGAR